MTTLPVAHPTPAADPARTERAALLRTGAVAVALASLANAVVAAGASATGVSLDVSGAPVPVPGFASLTAVLSAVGLVLAVVLDRRARQPRRTFVRTTAVLTALSLVPAAAADADVATRLLLVATHLLAAAVVVPALARRLRAA